MSTIALPRTLIENRLLAALPVEAYERLLPNLETVSLPLKVVLYEPGNPIEYVYFLNHGVVSLLITLVNGTLSEVGLVGNEGMVGVPLFLGVETTPLRAIVQVPAEAMRMKAQSFRDLVHTDNLLHGLLLRYTYTLIFQISQLAACNAHHSVEARCCRWMLMTRDRAQSDEFPLTQEFLSQMLGVRRAGVTVVARKLQEAGLIRYSRGHLKICDRAGLEAVSCQCHQLVKAEFDRLFGDG